MCHLQSKLCSWRAQALWNKFDKRANHKCYNRGKACPNTRVSFQRGPGIGKFRSQISTLTRLRLQLRAILSGAAWFFFGACSEAARWSAIPDEPQSIISVGTRVGSRITSSGAASSGSVNILT